MRLPIVLWPSLLCAAFSLAAQDVPAPSKPADVQGTVLEATSNEPIRKALVSLRKGEDVGIGTYTDEAGNFVLRDIDPGTYLISATRLGFVADPKTRSQRITVNAGGAPEPIILKLNRTGAVSGHIVDANGDPAMGVSIQVQQLNPKKNQPGGSYASTDDHGNYRAYNIPPGRYKISATYGSGSADPRIKMQVAKDKTKEAPPEAYGTTYYPGTLDGSRATIIQVEPGADMQGIDLGLLRTRTVRIRGKVSSVDAELAAPLVMVALSSLTGGISANTQIRSDGSFELSEVTPGKYLLSAVGFLQHGNQLAASQSLDVGETDIDDVQLMLSRAQNLTGAVLMPADRKLPAGLVVALRPKEPSHMQFQNQSGGLAQLTERGTFSIENVVPGDYDVMVGNVGKGDDLYVVSIQSGDRDLLASGLHLAEATPPPIEITLRANGAEIACTVTDDKQTPVPEAHVTLLPDPPRRSQYALRAECQTNASGKCTILGVAPGDYHAFATSPGEPNDLSDPATMENLEKNGKAVTVSQGDRTSLQIRVVPSDNQQ